LPATCAACLNTPQRWTRMCGILLIRPVWIMANYGGTMDLISVAMMGLMTPPSLGAYCLGLTILSAPNHDRTRKAVSNFDIVVSLRPLFSESAGNARHRNLYQQKSMRSQLARDHLKCTCGVDSNLSDFLRVLRNRQVLAPYPVGRCRQFFR